MPARILDPYFNSYVQRKNIVRDKDAKFGLSAILTSLHELVALLHCSQTMMVPEVNLKAHIHPDIVRVCVENKEKSVEQCIALLGEEIVGRVDFLNEIQHSEL